MMKGVSRGGVGDMTGAHDCAAESECDHGHKETDLPVPWIAPRSPTFVSVSLPHRHHVRHRACQAGLYCSQQREASCTFSPCLPGTLQCVLSQSSITDWVEILTSTNYDDEAYDGCGHSPASSGRETDAGAEYLNWSIP